MSTGATRDAAGRFRNTAPFAVRRWSARAVGDRMASLWAGVGALARHLHLCAGGDTGCSPRNFVGSPAHFAARQTVANGGGFAIGETLRRPPRRAPNPYDTAQATA